jgi:hypothetical protein
MTVGASGPHDPQRLRGLGGLQIAGTILLVLADSIPRLPAELRRSLVIRRGCLFSTLNTLCASGVILRGPRPKRGWTRSCHVRRASL